MRWKDRKRSANVEDRRGRSGGGFRQRPMPRGTRVRIPRGGSQGGPQRAGGSSLILLVVVGLLLWVFAGINPLQLLEILARQEGSVISAPQTPERSPAQTARDDEAAEFMAVVLAETEDAWNTIFAQSGSRYSAPRLVLYSGFTQTECGFGSSAVGPFYCPLDEKVYIDLSFFDMLSTQFDAPGDFAQAYVLAHEVGHHVQNKAGVLREFHEYRQRVGQQRANARSVQVELQADCYAGIWAHYADRSGIVEPGDIDEALGAASAVGDDVMQRRSQGYVVPESFNHGTAEQRSRWFRTGFDSGDPSDCDTFNAREI